MNIKLDPANGIPALNAEAETIKRPSGAKVSA
jgi:hypothetical protein